MSNNVLCWKCGESLEDLLLPFARNDECNACKVDVHVCKMCLFYDTRSNNHCREPIADDVNDKERSNFCDYFKVRSDAYQNENIDTAKKARADLNALFGDTTEDTTEPLSQSASAAEKAKIELEKLFGSDDKTN